MNAMMEQIAACLENHDIKARQEGDTLECTMNSDHGGWHMVVNADGDVVSVISLPPLRVPPEQRAAFAAQMVRMNAGQRMGAWHMDMENGQLYHCVSVPVAGLLENLDGTMQLMLRVSLSNAAPLMQQAAAHAYRWAEDANEEAAGANAPGASARIQFN